MLRFESVGVRRARVAKSSSCTVGVSFLVAGVSEGAVEAGVGGVGALVDAGDAIVSGAQGALELRGLPLRRGGLARRSLLGGLLRGALLAAGGGAVELAALVPLDPLLHRRGLAGGRGRPGRGDARGARSRRGGGGSGRAGDRARGERSGGGACLADLGAAAGALGLPGLDAGAQSAGAAAYRAADAALQGTAPAAQRAGEG